MKFMIFLTRFVTYLLESNFGAEFLGRGECRVQCILYTD